MKATIEAIEKALAQARAIKPESVESQAAICHLADAKRHLENRIKHDAAAPAPEPAAPAAPPVIGKTPSVPPQKPKA